MSSFLSQLIGQETGLVKQRISESLAKKMAKAQKKESKWRGLSSVLKTVANVALPGVGGAILGAAIDPIGRHFGAGARKSDIKASGDENIFGGRKAFKTARTGLQDAIDDYKQKNITNSILGYAGSALGGAALEKWGGGLKDALGFGGKNPALQQQALNMQNAQGAGRGTGFIMDSLEEGVGSEWSGTGLTEMYGYEQGGMVQKYENGGGVQQNAQKKRTQFKNVRVEPDNPYNKEMKKVMIDVWDTYQYDGINWNKTGTSETNPNYQNLTQGQMDKWRDEGRTENVGSSYMATQGEGINEFLRTPAVAAQINQARAGNAGAMENLVEMARQMVPEYANMKNKDIRGALEKNLTHVDIYGQGYQDVLSSGQTTLEGLQTNVQGARAQASSGAATSGIRTGGGGFRGADSISENLYAQVGDTYSGMQKNIQDEFDESFGGFETSILGING